MWQLFHCTRITIFCISFCSIFSCIYFSFSSCGFVCVLMQAHSYLLCCPLLFGINFSHLHHFCEDVCSTFFVCFFPSCFFVHRLYSLSLVLYARIRIHHSDFIFSHNNCQISFYSISVSKESTHLHRFSVCCTWIYLHQKRRNFTFPPSE